MSLIVSTKGGVDYSVSHSCLTGSGGSYLKYYNKRTDTNNAILDITNAGVLSYATTVISNFETLTRLKGIRFLSKAAVASNAITLKHLCALSTQCSSFIWVVDSSVHSLEGLLSGSLFDTAMALTADRIEIFEGGTIVNPFYLLLESQLFNIDKDSSLTFGCAANITTSQLMTVESGLSQVNSPTECKAATKKSLGLFIKGYNVSLTSAYAQNIVVSSNNLLISGSFFGVPQSYNLTSCWNPVDTSLVNCESFNENSSFPVYDTGTINYVLIGSVSKVRLFGGVVSASMVLVCSPRVQIYVDTVISSAGRGCQANEGPGAGGLANPLEGGGGGGFGGLGGGGSENNLGGSTYTGKGNFSVGYGGGATYNQSTVLSTTNTSAGGGLIIINGTDLLSFEGAIVVDGAPASQQGGGGSGGMIRLFTTFLAGNGTISAVGGSGGPLGGGGGGGGIVGIDNLGSSAEYNYEGTMDLHGGFILVEPEESKEQYPEVGNEGRIDWPLCNPGYGNDYEDFRMCYKCTIGYYKKGYNGNECKKCSNKPDHSDYTTAGWESNDCPYECNSGYVGDDCLVPFEEFIAGMGGYPAFFAGVACIGFVIFMPLLILRARKKKKMDEAEKQGNITPQQAFGTMTPSFTDFHQEKSSEWLNPVLEESLISGGKNTDEDIYAASADPYDIRKSGGDAAVSRASSVSTTTARGIDIDPFLLFFIFIVHSHCMPSLWAIL